MMLDVAQNLIFIMGVVVFFYVLSFFAYRWKNFDHTKEKFEDEDWWI